MERCVLSDRRMYNQRGQAVEGPIPESPSADITKRAAGKLYKNPLDCLIQTVRAEGPMAVYKVLGEWIVIDRRDFLRICCE
jgi:hypothetical protein